MTEARPILLRRREVEQRCQLSRSTIYHLMNQGRFPRPVRIGPGSVRWRVADLEKWESNLKPKGNDMDREQWEAAKPAVNDALEQIKRHADWVRVTFASGPEKRDEFLAQLTEFDWRIKAARDAAMPGDSE